MSNLTGNRQTCNIKPMQAKPPLIVGNWKMHKTAAETEEHVRLLKAAALPSSVRIWIAPPFTSIKAAAEAAKGSSIKIGAQNMSDLLFGAFTGEVSAPMIVEAGASFVILGHSERRKIFHEDDFMINRKVKLALRSHLKVILCVGESLEERERNQTEKVLSTQLKECLEDVPSDLAEEVIIAYEPVWAIGTGSAAKPEMLEEIHQLCKTCIANYWKLSPQKIRVLYGGSVNGSNAKSFLEVADVDGLLVGGASLDVNSFLEIINEAEAVK